MTNQKVKIAKTLFNLPDSSISTPEITWILSHLPDENILGKNSTNTVSDLWKKEMNHDSKSLLEAYDINGETVSLFLDLINDTFKECMSEDLHKNSALIEKIGNKVFEHEKKDEFMYLILSKFIETLEETKKNISGDDFLNLLKKLGGI